MYYVAEGVRLYCQETWRAVTQDQESAASTLTSEWVIALQSAVNCLNVAFHSLL